MNFIFISPNFPRNYYLWAESLKKHGVNVLGIGDSPYWDLEGRLKDSLTEYYYANLSDIAELERAVAYYKDKYGDIDYIESDNEWWLYTDAVLRQKFGVNTGFHPAEMEKIKAKSAMKEYFQKGGAKTMRYILVDGAKDKEKAKLFLEEVGYPLFVKPNVGVGAVDSYALHNDEEFDEFFKKRLPETYIMEEYVEGFIVSYDGICDSRSNVVFDTADHFMTPIADIVNEKEDYYYYNTPFELPFFDLDKEAFRKVGRSVVKSFGIKKRFFHIEFFVLTKDKPGLAKKGEFVALECNMRPAGGYTPDLMDYGSSCSVYDIYADVSGQLVNHLQQALKAEYMFHRDQQYVVVDGEVKIVDEFTGRIMEGRRYSEGLHQAIEAKEGVIVREENQTLATITLQNYFLMYDKLSGMTGTAMTEDAEFREVYHIPVQVIPPNKPVIRVDHDDLVYRTIDAKFKAVADDVVERHAKGQPCLVGTVSIENSERLSRILDKRGIKHNVLNAKFHEREAQIVAQAGREGAVTIATNMAGRGTDILLGGNPELIAEDFLRVDGVEPEEATPEQRSEALARAKEICDAEKERVKAAGGLCVIGTERHESRRIDNQLRGRSGRQGDPGETQFYLSLEDDLMRLFGGDRMDRISAMMQKYEMPDDMPIQNKLVTKAVESAQRKVEEVNFAMRKNVLDYDNVMNTQRQVIYEERNKILDGKDLMERVGEVTFDTVQREVASFCPEGKKHDEWDERGLERWLQELTGRKDVPSVEDGQDEGDVVEMVDEFVDTCFAEKAERIGQEPMHALSAQVMLRVIDTRWMAYLQEMDYLKTGIGLRGFGQRDPLVEYKSEAYAAFTELVNTMYEDFLRTILRLEVVVRPNAPQAQAPAEEEPDELRGARYSGPSEADGAQGGARAVASGVRTPAGPAPQGANPGASKPRTYRKADDPDPYVGVGRNDPCPCGSGKKFKNCHGRNR